MLIVLSICAVAAVVILGWSAVRIVHMLEDRYSYRRERSALEQHLREVTDELAGATARADELAAQVDKLRSDLQSSHDMLDKLHAELKSARRMIAIKMGRIEVGQIIHNDPRP